MKVTTWQMRLFLWLAFVLTPLTAQAQDAELPDTVDDEVVTEGDAEPGASADTEDTSNAPDSDASLPDAIPPDATPIATDAPGEDSSPEDTGLEEDVTPICEEGSTQELACVESDDLEVSTCLEGTWEIVTPCPENNCNPQCDGKSCGDDGCGGDCGKCALGEVCGPESTCVPAEGPCAATCEGQTEDGCWCDPDCNVYGDCCPGACEVCGYGCDGDKPSCEGRCDDTTPAACKCDAQCQTFGDCCEDVCDTCGYCESGETSRELLGACPANFPEAGCCADAETLHICANGLEWLEKCPEDTECGLLGSNTTVACVPSTDLEGIPANCLIETDTENSEPQASVPGSNTEGTDRIESEDPAAPDASENSDGDTVEAESEDTASGAVNGTENDGCKTHGEPAPLGLTLVSLLFVLATRRRHHLTPST